MSRDPAARLARLKVVYGDHWRFYRVPAGNITPPTDRPGFVAQRRDRPDVTLFAAGVDDLEVALTTWREPRS